MQRLYLSLESGKVSDFAMNDKCAAGTGRFLSILADTLGLPLTDLGEYRQGCPAAPPLIHVHGLCRI